MNRTFILVGGIPTKVLTLGTKSVCESPKKLILIIPGNTGQSSYYESFMHTVHEELGGKVPVWAISHAGCESVPQEQKDHMKLPDLKGNEFLFSLQGQLEHKIRFIEDHVPQDCELTLIGHSVGCHIILSLLNHFEDSGIRKGSTKSYMLFPVIERMYETSNGWWSWIQAAYLLSATVIFVRLLAFIPSSIKTKIIRYHFRRGRNAQPDPVCVDTTLDLLCPVVVRNAIYFGYTQLMTIRELDLSTVRRHVDSMRFYYGTTDSWCPLEFYHQLKSSVPTLNAVICEKNYEHAFVLYSSVEIGEIIAQWMRKDYTLV